MYNSFTCGCVEHIDVPKIHYLDVNGNPQSTRFGPGVRQQYMVQYVLKGKGYFNGRQLTPGQGFLVTPNMLEEYYPDESDPWEYLNFSSLDETMDKILPLYNADPQTNIFSFNSLDDLRTLSTIISQYHLESPSYHHVNISSLLITEYFLRALNSHIASRPKYTDDKDIFVQAQNYIFSQLHTQLRVEDITSMLNISQQYLHKIFTKYAHMSPKQYILNMKLREAKILLRKNPSLNITEVATSVGFSDIYAFSRFFASHEKISPSKYRSLHKK